jgi:hypothetical protein
MLQPDDLADESTWSFSKDWQNFEGDGTTMSTQGMMAHRGALSKFLFLRGSTVKTRSRLWNNNVVIFIDNEAQATRLANFLMEQMRDSVFLNSLYYVTSGRTDEQQLDSLLTGILKNSSSVHHQFYAWGVWAGTGVLEDYGLFNLGVGRDYPREDKPLFVMSEVLVSFQEMLNMLNPTAVLTVREDNIVIESALVVCRHMGIPAFTIRGAPHLKPKDGYLHALGALPEDYEDEIVATSLLNYLRKFKS